MMISKRSIVGATALLVSIASSGPVTAESDDCRFEVEIYFYLDAETRPPSGNPLLDAIVQKAEDCNSALLIVSGHVDPREEDTAGHLGLARADGIAKELRLRLPKTPILSQDLGIDRSDKRSPKGRVTVYAR